MSDSAPLSVSSVTRATDASTPPLSDSSPDADLPPHLAARRRLVVALTAAALLLVVALLPARAELDDGIVFINQEHDLVDSLAWGDMDGDGDLDVAVGSFDWVEGRIGLIYENSESGPFTLKWSLYQGGGEIIGFPAWGDIDGDGDLDISFGHSVFANTANGFVKVFHAPIEEYELRKKASWADFDGDGDLDFALGGTVYPNNNGSLSTAGVVIGVGEMSAWGDMDYDGDLDMALLGDEHQDVQIYRQEANGNYSLVIQAQLIDRRWDGDYDAYPSDLDWGDMDGDADLDLAVSTRDERASFLFRNTSTGFEIEQRDTPQGATSVAWGDWDNDGYPDLAYGTCPDELINCNDYGGGLRPAEVYGNWQGGNGERVLSQVPDWISDENDAEYVVWVDWDSDGDLDLSTAFDTDSELIHINEETGFRADVHTEVAANNGAWGNLDGDPALEFVTDGELGTADKAQIWDFVDDQLSPWPTSLGVSGWGVATGDFDGDNDLDIVVGGDVFRNQNGSFQHYWEATADDGEMQYPVWVDWDGNGELELTLQDATKVYLYQYDHQQDAFTLLWESPELIVVYYTAWGDLDGDGFLDLAVARGWNADFDNYLPSLVFRNTGSGMIQVWEAPTSHNTSLIDWGDWDGDGDSDLALGNWNDRNQVYANNGGQLELAWESADFYSTYYIAWLDYDSDGDLDLAAANEWHDVVLYANDGNTLGQPIALEYGETRSLTVGDADADGDLDMLVIDADQYDGETWAQFIENKRQDRQLQSPYHTAVTIRAPGVVANFYGVGRILDQSSIPINYTLYNNNGDTIGRAEFFYSLNGGGQWFSAKNSAGDNVQTNLAASPTGTNHTFSWDTRQSGLFGRFDNVVFRVDVYTHAKTPAPAGTYDYTNVAMRTFQRPTKVIAQTTPFRVRGTQVKVVNPTSQPVAGAIVYRLPDGEVLARPFGNGRVFTTDGSGYLQGHGELAIGDRLVALWPAPADQQPPDGYPYTVYYSSAAVTNEGLDMQPVDALGLQTLTISPNRPLLLFDLVVSLEWDARRDTNFLSQLQTDIRRASEILYDLSDGQAALGQVHVYHDKGYWGVANVVIPAGNHVRPAAMLGGLVPAPQADVDKNNVSHDAVYVPGQVRIGATWNRFGDIDGTLGEDWPRTLAHELSHYLFYLPDNYLGVNAGDGSLRLVDCAGSVMTDPYQPDYSEYLPRARWTGDCLLSVAQQYNGRADWETIDRAGFYPMLNPPGATALDGPHALPLAVTQIATFGPPEATTALAAPFFTVANEDGSPRAIAQGRGQAYLIKRQRQAAANDPTARYVVELGAPVGSLLQARGAQPGDELCVFDYSGTTTYLGCQTVGNNAGLIKIKPTGGWQPAVTVTGRSNDYKTVDVAVVAPNESALTAQLLPALGHASTAEIMSRDGDIWRVALTAPDGAFYGHVRIWAPDANPAHEIIVAYTNLEAWTSRSWGGYAYAWGDPPGGWGGYAYAWGGYAYAWGGYAYAWGSPVMSGDGQVSFLPEGSLFGQTAPLSLQSLPAAPALDAWLTPVGQAYRLRALTGAVPQGSVLFRYLARDVPAGLEDHLAIYYYSDTDRQWLALPTTLQKEFNHAAAPSQGAGVYLLVATVSLPPFVEGWNTFAYPVAGTRSVAAALASIENQYSSVYTFNGQTNTWELYDATVGPDLAAVVNTLTTVQYGHIYWLFANEATTLLLPTAPAAVAPTAVAPNRHFPPATYYGWVTATTGFTPVAGQTVTAFIGNVECGRTTLRSHDGRLAYAIQVQAETLVGAVNGCGRDGLMVEFRVNGVALAGQSRAWNNAAATYHPLGGQPISPDWRSQDINTAGLPAGATTPSGSGYTVSSYGRDIGTKADSQRFVYKTCTGDTSLVARITSFTGSNNTSPKVGLMFRTSLDAGARAFTVHLRRSPTDVLVKLRQRSDTAVLNVPLVNTLTWSGSAWLKLTRSGNQLTAFYSTNGTNWTRLNDPVTLPLPATYYCGMAVTAGSPTPTQPATATFDNLSTGETPPSTPSISDFNPKSGSAGTVVTISGANLANTTAVTFNGLAAASFTPSATQVQVTVPVGASDGLIRLTVGSQTVDTATAFDVTTPPVGGPDVFYLSTAANKVIGGLSIQPADIVRYTTSTNQWTMVYDGSDHATTQNINAFAMLNDGSLLLVFGAKQIINGIPYSPWDIVKFTPTNPNSFPLGGGTYSLWLDGQATAVGLSTTAEKIDALAANATGSVLYVSTSGAASVPKAGGGALKAQDEDVLTFTRSSPTAGSWNATPRLNATPLSSMSGFDINAYWEDANGNRYFTVVGTSVTLITGVVSGSADIVKLTPNGSGWTPSIVPWLASGTLGVSLDGLEIKPP